MTRTDAHRPSAIIPTDYYFVGFEHLEGNCPEATLAYRAIIQDHMKVTGGTYSHHQHGGNCHICGASCIYTALFYHKPTNSYVRTGLDCTEKLDASVDGTEFRKVVRAALEQVAGKRKAKAVLEAAGVGAAWAVYEANLKGYIAREETIVGEIVMKLVKYGSVSDKQLSFIGRLLHTIENRAAILAQRAAETAAAAPVPVTEDRVEIQGRVLSIRVPPPYSDMMTTKMLVQHADGWKVWGSLPRGLEAKVGDTIKFKARIKRSDKDEKFGFFQRPTSATVVAA